MKQKTPHLKRELGLVKATLAGVSVIVGAGIYALIGKGAALAGNAIWISFLLSAIVAMCTALSYAELSSMFPRDSAEYIYAKKSFGKMVAYVTAFLILFGTIIAAAAVALGFAGYLQQLVPVNIILLAAGAIISAGIVAFMKIEYSSDITIVFSIISIIGLLIIIAISAKFFGTADYFAMANGWSGVFSAAALIFFAFLGFEDIVKLSEETKDPKKNIPKAIILAIVSSSVLYILVAISAVSVLGYEALGKSSAPLADVANKVLGSNISLLLIIIALCATASTLLMLIIAASRAIYGLGEEGLLPKMFLKVHKKTMTPYVAIASVVVVSLFALFLGKIESAASLTDFAVFVTFVVINVSVIVLRYTESNVIRDFKVPFSIGRFPVIPLLGAVFCAFMIFHIPIKEIVYGCVLIAVGIVVYLVMGRK